MTRKCHIDAPTQSTVPINRSTEACAGHLYVLQNYLASNFSVSLSKVSQRLILKPCGRSFYGSIGCCSRKGTGKKGVCGFQFESRSNVVSNVLPSLPSHRAPPLPQCSDFTFHISQFASLAIIYKTRQRAPGENRGTHLPPSLPVLSLIGRANHPSLPPSLL